MLLQRIFHAFLIILGFWKLAELVITRVIVPLDRWQERQQISRTRRAAWQKEEED